MHNALVSDEEREGDRNRQREGGSQGIVGVTAPGRSCMWLFNLLLPLGRIDARDGSEGAALFLIFLLLLLLPVVLCKM